MSQVTTVLRMVSFSGETADRWLSVTNRERTFTKIASDKLYETETAIHDCNVETDLQRLSRNHQDFLREFYGPGMEMQMKSVNFIVHKQNLVVIWKILFKISSIAPPRLAHGLKHFLRNRLPIF